MTIKKINGKIFGANLTSAEKKAMDIEIRKQLAEMAEKHRLEVSSMILWELMEKYDFDENQLKDFFMNFDNDVHNLIEHYMLEEDDDAWLCTYKLKESGIDIYEWEKELIRNEKK